MDDLKAFLDDFPTRREFQLHCLRVYRFNAAIWAARRYEHSLRLGLAEHRGAAMRAAGIPCNHKGIPICEVCGEVLCPYTPDIHCESGLPLTPCDSAELRLTWGQADG